MKPKNKVRGYRNMVGLTQKDLGDKLGISTQAISQKEKGVTSFTDKEKIILLELFREVDKKLTIDSLFFYN